MDSNRPRTDEAGSAEEAIQSVSSVRGYRCGWMCVGVWVCACVISVAISSCAR